MQFDSQDLIQFWQALVNNNQPSSANFGQHASKLLQKPDNALWQTLFTTPVAPNPEAVRSVNQMADQLRHFLGILNDDWQRNKSPIGPVADSRAAHEAWNTFLDIGSDRFKAFAGSEDFATSLADCINAFTQQATAKDPVTAAHSLAGNLPGTVFSDTDPLHGERDVLLKRGTMTVYRYAPEAEPRVMPPVLIVYALINTADILDLDPERSLVRALLQRGIGVYLIDWGFPASEDASTGLSDYVNHRIKPAIDAVCEDSASEQLSLFGVCQGGVLSLSTAALYPSCINKVALAVTPIDFHTPDNLLSRWARDVDVSALVKQHGNVPGHALYWIFASINPFELIYRKYLKAATTMTSDGQVDEGVLRRFMRMERWVQNVPDHAGRAFEEFVTSLYQRNDLVNDRFTIGDEPVRLSQIKQPVLNFYATRDHIVPASAAQALGSFCTDYEEMQLTGGHIGAIVSQRNIDIIATRLSDWLDDN